ncbi:hexitol phosphatase HxpB [Affinibrenneria salicis]|uniref:Hexitol phosphatase HxpB n=1 Tax=Affinibrenneria salicis TaxID=2590031 RepID=A0A5J5G4G3_9GAMM|nr:hexitol phosphatase HxpB [Affinibrenneria salicis]KAA9001745.1 hexitol phosphatase HxpB [Affinibrenneria salicis]
MSGAYTVKAAIFDMDGLLIDSEPLWDLAELDVIRELGLNISLQDPMLDTLGLRIDLVVDLWYHHAPWTSPSRQQVVQQIIERALTLVEQRRPLLPGVEQALQLCRELKLKVGLASASPLFMLERVLEIFHLRDYFDVLVSAEHLPYSKPHPEVYLQAAEKLGVNPLECVTLEDSLNGVIATKAARMRSIVVPQAELRDDARWSLANRKLGSLLELQSADLLGR